MVNWAAASEVAKETDVYSKLIFAFFGLYVWELFQTSSFEWSLITRKRKFTWPLVIFFFLCRYCMLLALIGLIAASTVSSPIDCNALYTFNSWTGNMAILTASTSLMIRTIAIWDRQIKIIIPLGILCLAHWAILWRGMFIVHADFETDANACVVTASDHIFLNIGFFMTMGFDFIILCFTLAALSSKHKARSDLWNLLFQDGLVYFVITFLSNAVPAILNVLNLNTIMNVIATIPAATIASIAACRLVVRLQDFSNKDVYVHSTSHVTEMPRSPVRFTANHRYTLPRRPEVHVTTDHYVMQDFSPSTVTHSPITPRNGSALDLEAAKVITSLEDYDKESTETPKTTQPYSFAV